MSDLMQFLLARIAEDEERAKAAAAVPGGDQMLAGMPDALFEGLRVAFPRRVLAECEAKRRVVALHPLSDAADVCTLCTGPGIEWWPCPTILALAAPYCDHPDFDPAWRTQ